MLDSIDWLDVLAAGVAGYAFGAVYYMSLSRFWLDAVGFTAEDLAKSKSIQPFLRAAVGQFVLAATLCILAGPDIDLSGGVQMGALLWIGVVMTTMAVNHGFQSRKLALTIIDGLHWLGVLLIQGALIGML